MKLDWQRYLAFISALLCAMSVAMSAYASHGLEAEAQHRMLTASYFTFAHALAIIVLVRNGPIRSNFGACCLMLIGILLFSGSLAAAAVWQTPTTLAPSGGMALMAAWCWVAINFLMDRKH